MSIQPVPEQFKNLDITSRQRGAAPRPIQVVAVNNDAHAGYCATAGRNGLLSTPVKVGQVFASQQEAETHLGVTAGSIGSAMCLGRKNGKDYGVVRGVAFAKFTPATES